MQQLESLTNLNRVYIKIESTNLGCTTDPVCVCAWVYIPFLSSCVCSGNVSNRRAPTLISFSTLSAGICNGLGSFSHTIATVCVQENYT